MALYRVSIHKGTTTHNVIVRARYAEEAFREALIVLGIMDHDITRAEIILVEDVKTELQQLVENIDSQGR